MAPGRPPRRPLFFPICTAGGMRYAGRRGEANLPAFPAQTTCLAWAMDNGVADGYREVPQGTSDSPEE